VPFRTLAAAAGLVLLPLVSRVTAAWDAPKPLRNVMEREGNAATPEREGFSRASTR